MASKGGSKSSKPKMGSPAWQEKYGSKAKPFKKGGGRKK